MPLPPSKRVARKVLDIRGTHGSGKSHVVHSLLEMYGWGVPIEVKGKHIGHYIKELDCGILCKYRKGKGGGGVDSSLPQPERVVERIKLFYSRYRFTLLEGAFISHTYQRYADLADELGRQNYRFLFLDTPLDVCVERCRIRHTTRGSGNRKTEFSPQSAEHDYYADWVRLRPKFIANGYNVGVLNYLDPLTELLKEFQ